MARSLSLTLELDRISAEKFRAAQQDRTARMAGRLRRLRLVERMDRLVVDGGGAVSPVGQEHGDALPAGEGP